MSSTFLDFLAELKSRAGLLFFTLNREPMRDIVVNRGAPKLSVGKNKAKNNADLSRKKGKVYKD
jgi:hypothetical protein